MSWYSSQYNSKWKKNRKWKHNVLYDHISRTTVTDLKLHIPTFFRKYVWKFVDWRWRYNKKHTELRLSVMCFSDWLQYDWELNDRRKSFRKKKKYFINKSLNKKRRNFYIEKYVKGVIKFFLNILKNIR